MPHPTFAKGLDEREREAVDKLTRHIAGSPRKLLGVLQLVEIQQVMMWKKVCQKT